MFQVGLFELSAAMAVEDQPAGDDRQVGARLLDGVRVDPCAEHLAERFGGGVFGIGVVTQAFVDVLEQPAMVVAEEEAQFSG
ncbi:hypothetical protein IAE39_004054 [Pseudomonas sp. S37]|nr:hypothetical protein [Pseudomonas sp. S37]